MSIETLTCLLAEGDWRELIGPLVVFGIYAVAAILKKAAGGKSDSADEEEDEPTEPVVSPASEGEALPEKPRYRPLDEVTRPAAPAQSPQQRTLPYARPQQPRSTPSAVQQAELERQQRLQQLRDEQIQLARRRQLAQQQAEQAAVRQRTGQPAPKAVLRPAPSVPPRKTPQEKFRQAQTGQPAPVVPRLTPQPPRTAMPSAQTPPRVSVPKLPTAAAGLQRLLRDRNSLRKAMVLKEVLQKPLALR